jgi:hypothetical protein
MFRYFCQGRLADFYLRCQRSPEAGFSKLGIVTDMALIWQAPRLASPAQRAAEAPQEHRASRFLVQYTSYRRARGSSQELPVQSRTLQRRPPMTLSSQQGAGSRLRCGPLRVRGYGRGGPGR